jgi:hypothetical protein
VTADRYANLAPGAVTAALRSFARRYQAAVTSDPAREPDELADRVTKDGRAVRQVVADTIAALEHLDPALHRVLVSPEPAIPETAAGGEAGADGAGGRIFELVERLGAASASLADRLDRAPSADLVRTGTTPSGTRVSAIDIGRQAVRLTADNLLAVERAVGGRDGGGEDDD